jgi:hypothetical protein
VITRSDDRAATRRVTVGLAVWAAGYAAYRFYYAFGGQLGMIGRPSPAAHFRRDNATGGAIILVAALLPPIAAHAWRHRAARRTVAVVGWIAAVGCCMHASPCVERPRRHPDVHHRLGGVKAARIVVVSACSAVAPSSLPARTSSPAACRSA